jgi:anti-anti-sigma factor
MDIIQIEKNGIVCVTVKGRTEAELSPEFAEVVKKIVEGDKRRLLFDLGALEYLRSSVLRVILRAVKEINQKSGKVAICCLNGYAKEIFEANCLNNSIPITESIESGLNLLLPPLKAA